MTDVVTDAGHLFLASRLKRLAERMQADVSRVAAGAGLPIQPSQYPLLATLDRDGPQTVGGLAAALMASQPGVTRGVGKLAGMGLVEVRRDGRDRRERTVALTPAGEAALARSKRLVWPQVAAAARELTAGLAGPLLDQIAAIETRLAERPLHERAAAAPPPGLTIVDYEPGLAATFKAINAEWIADMYRMEPADLEVLDDPGGRIVAPGGAILFVAAEGLGIVGACALRRTGEDQYELTKMGVTAAARGLKAGEFLLRATIDRAFAMGARRLYLLTNRKSAAAIHLYEKLGFVHDAGIMAEFGRSYERCDVAMLYVGQGGPETSTTKIVTASQGQN